MTAISEGTVEANGLRFAYLAAGESGPLALCLHGFPDSAWTWRHLLPRLAEAGYRAVAPWMRGYAPTDVPADGCYQTGMLGIDANALHDALGGDGDAVLVGHDWGALAAYGAVHGTDDAGGRPWRRAVTLAVPPPGAIATGFLSYDQLRRSWYMYFFQSPFAEMAVAMNDLEFIDRLWADWSPGYDAVDDLDNVKDALRDAANLGAALGYYRAMLGGAGVTSDPKVTDLQAAAAGPVPVPTLYLHGRRDGCLGVDLAEAGRPFLAAGGSRMEVVDDTGHFLHLERPDEVNGSIVEFLKG